MPMFGDSQNSGEKMTEVCTLNNSKYSFNLLILFHSFVMLFFFNPGSSEPNWFQKQQRSESVPKAHASPSDVSPTP
jgi:hypothetical protein